MTNEFDGTIIRSNRRVVTITTDSGETFDGRVGTKHRTLVVGDRVRFHLEREEAVVEEMAPRRNSITRSYLEKRKTIAANVDRLMIVAGVAPLFQPLFIDRIIVSAVREEIPAFLLVNKIDLGLEDSLPLAN